MQPSLAEIEGACATVYAAMPPTPQFCWPQLCEAVGAEIWLKHENHTPVGAFKLRGGLVYFADMAGAGEMHNGVISATRGNHGQSVGYAARRHGIPATIIVPRGNSVEKNAAMTALGVRLIEHGDDFQAAREHAAVLAQADSLHMVPAFHPLLVRGVATAGLELLRAVPDIDTVYVPIGMGSGICALLAVRDALARPLTVVGVVSAHASAYAESFTRRQPVEMPVSTALADGLACRTPDPAALELIWHGVDRILQVTDLEVAAAMRLVFQCTHNVCEGAAAAAVAAALQERDRIAGRRIAVMLTGGNVDSDVFAAVLRKDGTGAH